LKNLFTHEDTKIDQYISNSTKFVRLEDKQSIVISEDLARKLFDRTDDIIGKPVRFNQQQTFFVSGVFNTLPQHSSQQFEFVLSFDYLFQQQPWVKSWDGNGPHNFVLVKEGTDINLLNKKIEGLIAKSSGDTSRRPIAVIFSEIAALAPMRSTGRAGIQKARSILRALTVVTGLLRPWAYTWRRGGLSPKPMGVIPARSS
jgi:hypothetical protein